MQYIFNPYLYRPSGQERGHTPMTSVEHIYWMHKVLYVEYVLHRMKAVEARPASFERYIVANFLMKHICRLRVICIIYTVFQWNALKTLKKFCSVRFLTVHNFAIAIYRWSGPTHYFDRTLYIAAVRVAMLFAITDVDIFDSYLISWWI